MHKKDAHREKANYTNFTSLAAINGSVHYFRP